MQITIPDKVKTIIGQLQDEGYEAYVVGGCVRDSVLGKVPNDWDITTNAEPADVKRLFRRTIDVGIEHGTVVVMLGNDSYEITTYRIDGDYEDSRHPSSVEFTKNLADDLKRRDFTMNAMAYNDKDGLVDLFGGIEDMNRRLIRAVGNPMERFSEDALRMMRAVRFSAQLGYAIETETEAAIQKLASTLSKISAERIREELEKLIVSPHPDRLRDAYRLGITKAILPEWDVMMECTQHNLHHYTTVGEHTIDTLINCVDADADLNQKDRRTLRLTMLLHDVAKPVVKTLGDDGYEHFKGHPPKSAEMTREILRRLKYDNATVKDVETLVMYHDDKPRLTMPKVRRFIIDTGVERMPIMIMIKRVDLAAHSDYLMDEKQEWQQEFEQKVQKVIDDGDCLAIKDLALSGKDLIELGIKPGPQLGNILNELMEYVIQDPKCNQREKLLQRVKEINEQ